MTTRNVLYAFFAVVFVAFIYQLSGILTPFALAALLAYLGDPLVNRMTKLHIPRTLGVVIVFVIFLGLVVGALVVLLPLLQREFVTLAGKIPAAIDWLQTTVVPWVKEHFGVDHPFDLEGLKNELPQHVAKAGGVAKVLVRTVTHSGLAIVGFLSDAVILLVVAFYLMRDWDSVLLSVQNIFLEKHQAKVVTIAKDCDTVVGAFLKGQLLVMLALAVTYSIGLSLIGLDIAILVGLLSGLVAIVPYLGFIIGILVASVAAYLQFHSIEPVFFVWLVYGVGVMLESSVYTPLLVGKKIGMHPVIVVFSVLAGGKLMGFFGVLIALPGASIITVLLRHLREYFVDEEKVCN